MSSAPIHQIAVDGIDGDPVSLADYAGKTLLIVNTASQCGFTPQYKGLEALWQQYQDRGLVVMGFPCNQFGGQEPGSNEEIASFCELRFQVSFPMFGKVDVNGANAHPLYQHLTAAKPGLLGSKGVKWNFTKFLVTPDGQVVGRYASNVKPLSSKLTSAIEKNLPA